MNPSAVLSNGTGNSRMSLDTDLRHHLRETMLEVSRAAQAVLGKPFPASLATPDKILSSTERNTGGKPSMLLDWEVLVFASFFYPFHDYQCHVMGALTNFAALSVLIFKEGRCNGAGGYIRESDQGCKKGGRGYSTVANHVCASEDGPGEAG